MAESQLRGPKLRHICLLQRMAMRNLIISLALLPVLGLRAQTYQPNWESLDQRPVPQWYKDAKFGIFIHWGVYSVPGWGPKGSYSEWYQYGLNHGDSARINFHHKKFGSLTYYQLADQFKAELFDPDQWAQLFERSGARYIVLTSKHHDGFANWPSHEASHDWGFPWNAWETGPHRDLLGDLFQAVRKTSVHPGLYYSLYEWFNPLWLRDRTRYVAEHAWPQMKDLVNTYRPEVFWTDGDWDASDSTWRSTEFLAWLYNESPVRDRVVTYDRWGAGIRFHHGGVYTPEYQPDLDFENHYWEESRGMGFSYGYNREEDSWDYNSPQTLVLNLVDKVSRGGNFLLDIGPDEHGKIPPIMEERLLQIGHWLSLNGEAIYHTVRWRAPSQWSAGRRDYRAGSGGGDLLLKLCLDPDPGYAVKECFFTYHADSNNLYLILPRWPAKNRFIVQDLQIPDQTRVELLETHQAVAWRQEGKGISLQLPEFDPNRQHSDYAFVIKIFHCGAYAPRVQVQITYPEEPLTPVVAVQGASGLSYRYTLDGSLPDRSSALYTGPFPVVQPALFSVRAFSEGLLPGAVFSIPLEILHWQDASKPVPVEPGLVRSNYELSASSVADLNDAKPVRTGVSKNISLKDSTRAEHFGLLYSGYFRAPADGRYRFFLSSDDGSKLWIDNQLCIDLDGLHGESEKAGTVALRKGLHHVRLAYFQATGGAALTLQYSLNEGPRAAVPDSLFFH